MVENKTTECKREYIDDIKYTVVAFANTEGGKIYIGIRDDGSVCGVENTDAAMLRVTNMIRDSIRPDVTMFTECAVEAMEGKSVVVLTVQRGTAAPITSPERASVRRGYMYARMLPPFRRQKLRSSI